MSLHSGSLALTQNPSSTEKNGILFDLHDNYGRLGFGIEEYEQKNPLAWPGFASENVLGLVLTITSFSECNPLRGEESIFIVYCSEPVFKPGVVKSWRLSTVPKFFRLGALISLGTRLQILQILVKPSDIQEVTSSSWRQFCAQPEMSRS